MIWHRNAKPATDEERAHLTKVKALPCIACAIAGVIDQCGPSEVHHLLSGGARRGHMFVLPLGSYHHRGISKDGTAKARMFDLYGPSLVDGSKLFHAEYGSDEQLLLLLNQVLDGQGFGRPIMRWSFDANGSPV